MALITRYRACVLVKLVERNERTERVWVYPSACSMVLVRWRFELPHQADEGVRAPSPSDLWPPTRSGNTGGERDGVRETNADWASALVAGAPPPPRVKAGRCAVDLALAVSGVGAARAMETKGWVAPLERRGPRSTVGGRVGSESIEGSSRYTKFSLLPRMLESRAGEVPLCSDATLLVGKGNLGYVLGSLGS